MAKKVTVQDCLDEIKRLRAECARLHRLVAERRPEIVSLRRLEVELRDYLHGGAQAIVRAHELALDVLRGSHDLPSTEEISGCLSDERDRVYQALGESEAVGAVARSDGSSTD